MTKIEECFIQIEDAISIARYAEAYDYDYELAIKELERAEREIAAAKKELTALVNSEDVK